MSPFGAVRWTWIYPKADVPRGDMVGYRANGLSVNSTGYIVAGEVIHKSGKANPLILLTDTEGESPNLFSVTLPSAAGNTGLSAQAAAEVGDDEILVLGSVEGLPETMILAKINTATPTSPVVAWDWAYEGGNSTVINKLFVDGNQNVTIGGTVTRNNFSDFRLIRAVQNFQGAGFDIPYGDPELNERANGICKTANGFAMIGSTNVDGKTDRDILFTRVSETGAVLSTRTYPVYFPGTEIPVNLDEEGNGICTTSDGGFIILATITSTTSEGNVLGRGEKDYYLMKINAFGDVEWSRAFGSRRDDVGVSVSQADDGGYVILGYTKLANVETIALIKTNEFGEIE